VKTDESHRSCWLVESATCPRPPEDLLGQAPARAWDTPDLDLGRAAAPESQDKANPAAHPTLLAGILARLVLPVLALVGVLWNCLLVFAFVWGMPQNDFNRMYYSAAAFWSGKDMYGWNPATPARVDEDTVIKLWNMNPPHFHLVMLPFALMSEEFALVFWWLVNFLCLVYSLRLICRELDIRLTPEVRRYGLVGMLGFTATSAVIITGQLSFLLMVPITLMWLHARHGRWVAAAAYLGLVMSVKPFLLLLIPYLLLRRRWEAVAAAFGVAAFCFATGLAVFGFVNHQSWYGVLGLAGDWAWLPLNASLRGMLDRTLMDTPYFDPPVILAAEQVRLAWVVLGLVIAGVTLAAVRKDDSPAGVDRALGLLLVASILLCPLGWTYYFWLPLGPVMAVVLSWYRQSAAEPVPCGRRWPRRLWWAALPGLCLPVHYTEMFQPSELATVVVANLSFWSTLAIWAALLLTRYPAGAGWAWRSRGVTPLVPVGE
jgi:Glycosyltransferase family 87